MPETTENLDNINNGVKPKRDTWTHERVGVLIHTFTDQGLDIARKKMLAEYGIAPERTEAKLAEMKYLALDPDEVNTVDAFAAFLLAMDAPSRGLAMRRLRAAVKNGDGDA